jgi:hypothetical protein
MRVHTISSPVLGGCCGDLSARLTADGAIFNRRRHVSLMEYRERPAISRAELYYMHKFLTAATSDPNSAYPYQEEINLANCAVNLLQRSWSRQMSSFVVRRSLLHDQRSRRIVSSCRSFNDTYRNVGSIDYRFRLSLSVPPLSATFDCLHIDKIIRARQFLAPLREEALSLAAVFHD